MIEAIKDKVKELLDSGEIKGFLGLAQKNGHVAPHLYQSVDELDIMVLGDQDKAGDARYPLTKYLTNIYKAYPEDTFGILTRGCDDRALTTLYTWNQLNPEKVVTVGIACPQELADACECAQPFPQDIVAGEVAEGRESSSVAEVDNMVLADRFDFWMNEFVKCIKCYGCSNVCPMCFCNDCSLKCDELVKSGELPPEIPVFHHTRAMHMVGRCIDCGLCEEACPSDIPLRTLYKKVNSIMGDKFDFQTGIKRGQRSPLNKIDK
ncbi:4Fe-4S binding protein [Desulfopila sp. IMCC35008]|uniref:4Fe-4S binding protein n=1 Tax=Desulfopila sp. IMCC35008 TaxID=2653858 RepID=UPI0013D1BF73|nr:4Fe-4S binding protein [Desulfopila sp. IMCC35008]